MSTLEKDEPPAYVATCDNPLAPSQMAAVVQNNSTTANDHHHRTSIAGNNRRAAMMKKIKPKKIWKDFVSDTLLEARMHSASHSNRTLGIDDEVLYADDTYLSRINSWASVEEYMPEGGSLGAAVFGIIKGTVGCAILYLPRGFQISGYAVAVPSMFFATFMYIYNAYRLLDCWKVEHERDVERLRNNVKLAEYGQGEDKENDHINNIKAIPMLTYPEVARRAFGSWSMLVDIGIASLQFGVCLTYLIFVPHNLKECTEALFGVNISKVYFLLLMVGLEIPLGWIRDIRKLTPTNVVATALIAYGLFFVLIMAFIEGFTINEQTNTLVFAENLADLPAITGSWFLFVGTSFFMMEGSITLIMPLQESIQRKEDRDLFPDTNRTVTSCIVVFYILFSLICCGAFGDSIHTALTASLDGTLATTIQFAYSVAVILTFPLQAFPAMEVVNDNLFGSEKGIEKSSEAAKLDDVQRRVMSSLIICILGVIAICAIDYLGHVVSILGSLFGIPLALVIPPLMHNTLVPDSSMATRRMNYGVVVIGVTAMGVTSFATIVTWGETSEGR